MNPAHREQIERILEKLKRVRQQFPDDLGAETHRYQLNPPIKEQALLDFEAEHQIRLPEEFRAFLLYAGNGGAGPYYGIYPLEKWNDFSDWIGDELSPDYLSRPCPLYFRMERTDDWADQFDTKTPFQGTLSIGSQGCSYEMVLIVTGACRGRVVYADADGQTPFVTYEPDFLTWYERWLDELLGGYKIFWFGMDMGGTEAELQTLLKDPESSDLDKADALCALWRFSKISTESQALIPSFLSDSHSEVRASACRMIRIFELHYAEEAVGKLLSDAAPEPRQEAILTLMEFDAARWRDRVFARLRDPVQSVTEAAFRTLDKAGALSRTQLLALINDPPNEDIQYRAVYTIKWKPEDVDLLLKLLGHSQDMIRFYTTLGLRQISAREAVEPVIAALDHETDPLTRGSILKLLAELDCGPSRDVLLEWAEKGDDFERMESVEGLSQLGDERVIPVAKKMLQETKRPVQFDASGFSRRGNLRSIGELVDEILSKSTSRAIRRLSSRHAWWKFW
ncbi:HEAT repeat domain-containing protein [Gimesia maris]|uniref:HEAT repeat domain-containing protein n=1 Tax=Gimesia maris TaxID=122 RepID=UPI00241C6367|nr:HEAT repeat domain-containing protein [Gimesia maris]